MLMTPDRDSHIRKLLMTAVPTPDPAPHEDWNAVLERAGATHGVPRSRRLVWLGRSSAAVAVATAIFAAILLWPAANQGSVLDRALATIGDGPIIHVTYRFKKNYEYVDLETGRKTRLYQEYEEWLDPSGALRTIYRVNGHLNVTVLAPGTLPLSRHQKETYSGILNGYRKALENGTAKLSAKTRFHGRDIYWVRFKGQKMLNVSNHKKRYQEWALEVAIDAATYKPVYLYETINGRPQPVTGQAIVSVETLPSGSVDFTPTPNNRAGGYLVESGGSPVNPVDLTAELNTGAPAKALGARPIWLGPNYRGLKLDFLRAGNVTWGFGPRSGHPSDLKLHHAPSVELCYGGASIAKVGYSHGIYSTVTYCNYRRPYVLLKEAREPTPDFGWGWPRTTWNPDGGTFTIPKGSMVVFPGGGQGLVIEHGIYISIEAR
ncbi:MAG: hypothetical protein ABSC36_01950, partial [Gaiellaceae bacterium]